MKRIWPKIFIAALIAPLMFVMGCADEGGSGEVIDGGVNTTGLYIQIASGNMHTCGIDTSSSAGTLKCWGDNLYGQLGDGTQTSRLLPTVADSGTVYTQVTAGTDHTCGITSTHALKCWGRNNFGQLGNGTTTDSSVPLIIDGGTSYTEISISGGSSCGIVMGGQLKCWGYNGFGGLGDNTTVNKSSPTVIDVMTLYKLISVGELYSCGITTSDVLKCWGNNQSGQLGDGSTVSRFIPTVIDAGTSYLKVSASTLASFFTCGLTTSNKLKCWGANQYGQLGDGTTTPHTSPTAINISKDYSDVSVGYVHTCAVEYGSGTLYCWGQNAYGQLGDYTTNPHWSGVLADSSKIYATISLGYNYTCGRTTQNLLRCWGRNDYGQVGDSTTVDVLFPKSIR